MAAVGCFRTARLRFAGLNEGTELVGDLELISLSGTIATDAAVHLHMAVADHTGLLRAGHLLTGCVVRTTAEIIIAESADLHFSRPVDPLTGYRELHPEARR